MSPLQQESTALARILRAQPGFDQLPDADFAELSKAARPIAAAARSKLFDYGALPLGLIVATGLLRLLARDERENPSPRSALALARWWGISLGTRHHGLGRCGCPANTAVGDSQPVSRLCPPTLLQQALAGASPKSFMPLPA